MARPPTEDLTTPHGPQNGTSRIVSVADNETRDRRYLWFIAGGVVLAFLIGFFMLVLSMSIDWR